MAKKKWSRTERMAFGVFIIAVFGLLINGCSSIDSTTEIVDADIMDVDDIYASSSLDDIDCQGNAECFVGIVTKIVDGDTIDVDGVRVRLSLANTPERGEEGYYEAIEFVEDLCPVGHEVLVDEDDGQTGGSYGRLIGVVYCDEYNLNQLLVEEDYAVISERYCDSSEFSQEFWAQENGC